MPSRADMRHMAVLTHEASPKRAASIASVRSRGLGMPRVSSTSFFALICLLVAAAAPPAAAQFSSNVTLATDYVFRGISQTLGDPAIQGGFDYEAEFGVHAGVWASNLRYVEDLEPSDGTDLELDLYAGFTRSFSDSRAGIVFIRYFYPGSLAGADGDYNELILSFGFRDALTGELGLSDDVFGTGEPGVSYRIATETPVVLGFAVHTGMGYYDLNEALGTGYMDFHAGASWSRDTYRLAVTFHNTDESGAALFGGRAKERVVFSAGASF